MSAKTKTMPEDKTYCDLIGNTPLVRIDRCLPASVKANNVRMLLKMEMQNPGGSIKDRVAKNIIDEAEKQGLLKPGGTVVEFTSGNTGIGLAMVCAAKGYKFICCMPQVPTIMERYMICRQFGAQVHLTAPALGFAGLRKYAEQLVKDNDYFLANQFYNQANYEIHYKTTGPDVWEQSGQIIDYFIAGVGTGGTIRGAGQYLVEKNPDCKVIAVEPTESRIHTGATHKTHSILGIGAGVPVPFLVNLAPDQPLDGDGPRGHISEFAHCSGEEATLMALKLCQEEGIMLGPSSGATVKVALDVAQRPEAAGKTIVVICASHGIRYTQHPLWGAVAKEATKALPSTPNLDPDADLLLWKSEAFNPVGN